MKINEMYLIFDENNELVKNYITTSGQAMCNRFGCISLKQEIDSLKGLLETHKETEKEIDELLNKWEQAETNAKETAINVLTTMPYKKSFYSENYKELSTKESNLYASYHDLVHTILTNEEIDKIQKSIHYDFMSDLFIDKMIELLESKEV